MLINLNHLSFHVPGKRSDILIYEALWKVGLTEGEESSRGKGIGVVF